jgi:hypothetical protein
MLYLFLRELRDGLLGNLLMMGGLLAVAVVVELARPLAGTSEVVNVMILVIMVLLSFVAGERCFPTDLKERRLLFLNVLPVSRWRICLSILGARFLAFLAVTALVLLLRPSVFAFRSQNDPAATSVVLTTLPVLFSSGAVLSLIFRTPAITYIVGYPMMLVVLFEADSYRRYGEPGSFRLWYLFLFLATLISVLLCLGFFQKGEFNLGRRKWTNLSLLSACAVIWWVSIYAIAVHPRIYDVRAKWHRSYDLPGIPFFYRYSEDRVVSRSGRYLLVVESLSGHPAQERISVVDALSGALVGSRELRNVLWVGWSGDSDIVEALMTKVSKVFPSPPGIPPSTLWIRLSPAADILSTTEFPETLALRALSPLGEILVAREGESTRAFYLDGRRGESTDLAHGPPGQATIWSSGSEEVIVRVASSPFLPGAIWLLKGAGRKPLPEPVQTITKPHVIAGKLIESSEAAQAVLEREFSRPVAGGKAALGRFVLPEQRSFFLDSGQGVFFLESAKGGNFALWAYSRAFPRWRMLAGDTANYRDWRDYNVYSDQPTLLDIQPNRGFAAYQRGHSFFLYDAALGREIMLPGSEGASVESIRLLNFYGQAGTLVYVTFRTASSPALVSRGFIYRPRSGEIGEIFEWNFNLPAFGALIYFDEQGWSIWDTRQGILRVSPKGETMKLW